MAQTATLTVRLPSKLKKELDRLAKTSRRSKTVVAAEAIQAYLDLNAWQVEHIRQALAEAEAGGPFARHEDVVRWMESWGTDHEGSSTFQVERASG